MSNIIVPQQPQIFVPASKIVTLEKSELNALCGMQRKMYLDYLKDLIVNHQRVDLLATQVLGYQVMPFHLNMLQFQIKHTNNLQLVFRGAGKSTICTVAKAIWYICVWPDVRIVIASKTVNQAQARPKEIKGHLEGNSLLKEMFGEFYSKTIWNARQIEVAQRTSNDATPTVACVGAKGSIAGAHFDIEFSDDLIDKTNSHTEVTREEVDEWYSSTFSPMLDPPDPKYPFRGHRHRVGTRYHYLDQYGRWIKKSEDLVKAGEEPFLHVNIIPALHPITGQSPWPERWTVKEIVKRRNEIGPIAFGAQYLCSTDAMKGEIFEMDHCQPIPWEDVQKLLDQDKIDTYMGIDLAISEKQEADEFAIVVVGKTVLDGKYRYFVLDSYSGRLRFKQQTKAIIAMNDKWNCKKIAIDAQAYQVAKYQELCDDYPHLKSKLKPMLARKGDDKVSRAWRITPLFENKQIFFPEKKINVAGEVTMDTPFWKLRHQLLLFPSGDHDDLYDAFEYALNVATNKRENTKKEYFGVL